MHDDKENKTILKAYDLLEFLPGFAWEVNRILQISCGLIL